MWLKVRSLESLIMSPCIYCGTDDTQAEILNRRRQASGEQLFFAVQITQEGLFFFFNSQAYCVNNASPIFSESAVDEFWSQNHIGHFFPGNFQVLILDLVDLEARLMKKK